MRKAPDVKDLVDGVLANNRAKIGQAITLVESNNPHHQVWAQELLVSLLPSTGQEKVHRIGVSGVPGAGKSTFIEAIGCWLLDQGFKVAVLAVDPSSTLSGGSILGDKTRMVQLASDPRAFVRPSPSAGALGGVARKTRETMTVLEAAGYDIILVETVGVGQSEVIVSEMVDTFLVLMLANAGDELQGIKRGILELVDVLAVNKCDGQNEIMAKEARNRYERSLMYSRSRWEPWNPPVLAISSTTKKGIIEIWEKLQEHKSLLIEHGELSRRRQNQLLSWTWALVQEHILNRLKTHEKVLNLTPILEEQVVNGQTTPTLAAKSILEAFLQK